MLKAEEAQKRLESFRSDQYVSERTARLAGLAEAIRPDARTLFGLEKQAAQEDDSAPHWERYHKQRAREQAAFRALSPEARQSAIRAVYPELAPYVIRALKDAERLPYTAGHIRKPFRAPTRPALLDDQRMSLMTSFVAGLAHYPPDIQWIAAWAPHAWPHNDGFVSRLLAAAIDEGGATGQAVFDILVASAKGEHEIGQMGRHVVRSLLIASRTDGWEFVEKLLIAAQREEGLRQSILEAVDESHPQAFRRFLRLVLEHDLVRFSATVRAVDVWLGFQWDAMSAAKARRIIELALKFLEDPAAGDAAIAAAAALPAKAEAPKAKGKKLVEADERVEPAYIALWAKAFDDVGTALTPARSLLKAADADVRFIATHLLCQLELRDEVSADLAAMLDDADERVAARALAHFPHNRYRARSSSPQLDDLFERLERVMARAPAKAVKLAPIVWPWMSFVWGKEISGAALLGALGQRPPTRLLPHLGHFDSSTRFWAAKLLGDTQDKSPATREALLALVADPSRQVRSEAVKHLGKCSVSPEESRKLEEMLTRKASDLRRGILTLLLGQPDEAALASADRLLGQRSELPRLAGLELLRELHAAKRLVEASRQRAQRYRAERPTLSHDETMQLDALTAPAQQALTLDDCLGLIDPARRTAPLQPQSRQVQYVTPAARELLASLDDLVHQNREKPFTPVNRHGEAREEVLLGNATWHFPHVDPSKPVEPQLASLPYSEVWLTWFDQRPSSMRDADGLELLRATWLTQHPRRHSYAHIKQPDWLEAIEQLMRPAGDLSIHYPSVVISLLSWLSSLHPPLAPHVLLLDGLENGLAQIPPDKLATVQQQPYGGAGGVAWRQHGSPVMQWALLAVPDSWPVEAKARLYRLWRWIDEPGVAIPRQRPYLPVLLAAYQAGGATEADLYDHFLGPRHTSHSGADFSELGRLCALKPAEVVQKHPFLQPILDRCRARVLEIELARGETPTLISQAALALRHSGGLSVLRDYLRAAEKNTFSRGFAWRSDGKAVVFSHVIRVTYPADGDTPEQFAAAMREAGVDEGRLVELAVYAPQWVDHVAHTLNWPHLPEAVWWIHAHTRDRGWSVDPELRERWKAQVARRTPLDAEDLLDGAVDVAWFGRTYHDMGKTRWQAVHAAAKYAASGGGHKRAQLFADAMLGRVKPRELITRIVSKRNQEAARALGLVPLPAGEKARPQMLARYKTLQEFIRTSRQFGSQRQASEKRAAAIGMENLARTAGYPDPLRLQWAMEAQACADLARGPVQTRAGEVTVTLTIGADGQPDIACEKKGKVLAAIPPAAKRVPAVAELVERRTDLKRSASRMRLSLEQAMVRGDSFTTGELRELMGNPLLSPMLQRLVFVGEGVLGYPVDGGQGLLNAAGKIEPLKKGESLRLAHPHDLLDTRHWPQWQRDCFTRELVQPFKQVFRELYVLTATEKQARDISRRYAGHQVQPRQALSLLGTRGWITSPEEGVFRPFHDAGWTAWLTFQEAFYTPADIEGLTLEGVRFAQKGDRKDWSPLGDVPPRLFSEVMRDLDLVVSVAHRGGVDPEASASTVQVRSALLSETLKLLGLKNVRIADTHALVKGKLAEYTVHLGSAVTHQQPGGALHIVAVHSQHRGRLFLPFADDDPKTAEVLSKVLLLARDTEIKDPNLLAQIRGLGSAG